jgi:hypothetical protein
MKTIPVPVDQVGRTISFRPTPSSDILIGDVTRVWFVMGEDSRYPKGSKGYQNGMRQLFKKIAVELPDGRTLNMPCEHEDVKSLRMVAENSMTDHW